MPLRHSVRHLPTGSAAGCRAPARHARQLLHGKHASRSTPGLALPPCDPPYAVPRLSAHRHTRQDGTERLVNRAPPFEMQLLALNAYTPAQLKYFGYAVNSYLAQQATTDLLVFNPDSGACVATKGRRGVLVRALSRAIRDEKLA